MTRLRPMLRWLAGAAFYYSGAFRLLLGRRGRQEAVCVLGLHRILDPSARARSNSQGSIVLGDEAFEQALDFLSRHFEPVSMSEFLAGAGRGSRPRCVITFDDGWEDNYTTAYPALKGRRLPATLFLATGMIGGPTTFWVERLRAGCAEPTRFARVREELAPVMKKSPEQVTLEGAIEHLKHMPADSRQQLLGQWLPLTANGCEGDAMLSWEQVREMSRDGIDFGSHTDSHPLLPYENEAVVERELRVSKQKIESAVARKVRAFAYPNGDWDERSRQGVERAGYACAFTTRSGWYRPGKDPYTAPRILLHDGNVTGPGGKFSPAAFSLTLTGWRG